LNGKEEALGAFLHREMDFQSFKRKKGGGLLVQEGAAARKAGTYWRFHSIGRKVGKRRKKEANKEILEEVRSTALPVGLMKEDRIRSPF